MRHAHFYESDTGIFTGQSFSFSGNERMLAANTPAGCGSYEGDVDYLSQRMDLETGRVVDYVPAQPASDCEWNPQLRRWVKTSSALERAQLVADAKSRIAALEASQDRVIREDRLRPNDRDPKDNKTPRDRLQEIDEQIATLRAVISAGTDTSAP